MKSAPSKKKEDAAKSSQIGQGYNDARGEVPDKKDIPKHNGQNVNNDPKHWFEKVGEPKQ